jgi:hypothetical protein
MSRLLCPCLLVLAITFSGSCARAADGEADAKRTERLVIICKVWGTVRYAHPYLAYKDIDWDAALIATLPRVEAAKDDDEFRVAVQAMLDRLGDPATRVARKALPPQGDQPARGSKEENRALFTWVDDVLAIHLDSVPPFSKLTDPKTRETLLAAVAKASGVIVDLRGEDKPGFVGDLVLNWLYPLLPARETRLPAECYILHSGYRPQTGKTSGGYFSAFQTTRPKVIPAAPGAKGKQTVFLVVEQTEIPPVALALQAAGGAFLVAQGKVGPALGSGRRAVPLAGDFEVQIRTTELIGQIGPIRPDAEVPAEADRGPKGPAFQKALALLREAPRPKKLVPVQEDVAPPEKVWRPDKQYEAMAYPERDYRLLALFRFWSVIHHFYPYKDLLDQDWDTVLPGFLPRFAAARDAFEYGQAVAEMAACIQDTHTHVAGNKELNRFFGEAAPPVALRLIEGKPAVTDLLDAETVKAQGWRLATWCWPSMASRPISG